MATKQPPTKKTRPAKKASKKRPRKASAKPATKKRQSKAPAKSSQPTMPAKPSTKRAAGKSPSAPVSTPAPVPVPAPVSVQVPLPAPSSKGPGPRQATSSRPPSYLESVPQDHAELVSGLFRVVRGAAKDLKTLVTQAIAMSNQKNDHPRR